MLSITLLNLLLLSQLVRTRKSADQAQPDLVLLGSDTHLDAKFYEQTARNILAELNITDALEKSTAAAGPAERYSANKRFDLYIAIELASLTTSGIV